MNENETLAPPILKSSADIARYERQERYLDAFAITGSLGASCNATGVPPATIQRWDNDDLHGFQKRLADAKILALGVVESEIHRRAVEGIDHPVIHHGVITDTYKEYSDNLLMFKGKRLDPAYKDNYDSRPTHQEIKVTSITYNMPAGVTPPVQVPAPGLTVDGATVELGDGAEPGAEAAASG